jgi:hypothetical protein
VAAASLAIGPNCGALAGVETAAQATQLGWTQKSLSWGPAVTWTVLTFRGVRGENLGIDWGEWVDEGRRRAQKVVVSGLV